MKEVQNLRQTISTNSKIVRTYVIHIKSSHFTKFLKFYAPLHTTQIQISLNEINLSRLLGAFQISPDLSIFQNPLSKKN